MILITPDTITPGCDSMSNVICEAVNEYRPDYTQDHDNCGGNYVELKMHKLIYTSRSDTSFSQAVALENTLSDDTKEDILASYNSTDFTMNKYVNDENIPTLEFQSINFHNYFIEIERYLDDHSERQMSRHLKKLVNKIDASFEFNEDCQNPMYPKLFNQHNFVDWYAGTPHFFDDEVMIDRCDFLKDINNAIVHYVHNYACSGDEKKIKRKKRKLTYRFCPNRFGNSMKTYF
ncbi:unnamed protein product [Oikopleura dioica]|uniref:Uncharacterized protein n=1 Tax=Oikopleura dioica TaxID=34765 RepID=E4YIA2_OIKDI|nr:unnamed protein product [Oikopleura dioica]